MFCQGRDIRQCEIATKALKHSHFPPRRHTSEVQDHRTSSPNHIYTSSTLSHLSPLLSGQCLTDQIQCSTICVVYLGIRAQSSECDREFAWTNHYVELRRPTRDFLARHMRIVLPSFLQHLPSSLRPFCTSL